jgi:uncharacterized RDD family membrane protein YckC
MQIHVARNGHRMGPFSLEEVNRQLAAGSLSPSDLAWYEGIPNWVSLSQVPGVGTSASVPDTAAPAVASASRTLVADSSYGGFWIRLVAYILDVIILGIPIAILRFALNPSDPSSGHPALVFVLTIVIEIAYFAGFWSSEWQATLGQKICGLRVVGATDFGKISFGRAVGRSFAMILSGLIFCIGFLMIAFTERKQGLHDMIAGTYVIKS